MTATAPDGQTAPADPDGDVLRCEHIAKNFGMVTALRDVNMRLGRGEVRGLIGDNIPLLGRVVAIADCYDAMTSDRPYRKGMPPWEALEEIVENKGKQFDPRVVESFKRVMSEKLERV